MKKAFLICTILLSLILPLFSEDNKGEVEITTITIDNARETNYKKDEETGNDVIVLEGAVELSIEKGDTESDIKADKISYDRQTEMLYAEGNVVITTKGSGSGGETTTASSLLLNTSTLEGVFDGGKVVQTKSDALNLPSGSTLIVFSDAFGKGNDNVIAFKNSSLTFCDDENPHWHIDATRTWLLPGGEFAFFNALLFVGPVPVLYFPAFYYPKDELLFNPVFSYKKRQGYSVQTTTSLYGRKSLSDSVAESNNKNSNDAEKKADDKLDSDALYNFMKPTSLKQQRREGLILHNLDEDFSGDTSQYLKLLADWYSNLGAFVGIDGKFKPSKNYITDLSFNLDLGFSKTLFTHDGEYTYYSPTGKLYNDSSTFLGVTLPFRYAANINFTLSKPFYLSVSLPIYSDPFFVSDFKSERSESMDWISFLLDDDLKNKKETGGNEISSFAWKISGSYNPTLPDFFKPYINSLSMSFDSSVNFSSLNTNNGLLEYKEGESVESVWKYNTPLRKFYYPSYIKPIQISMRMGGNLLSFPMTSSYKSFEKPNYPITLNKPDELKTEKEIEEEKKKALEESSQDKKEPVKEDVKEENKDVMEDYKYYLPDFNVSLPSVTNLTGLSYNLNYNVNTDLSTQISYSATNLKKATDFDWKNIQSFMYTFTSPITISSSLKYGNSFFSMDNNFSYNPVLQRHPFISSDIKNGGYDERAQNNLILADYKAERQDFNNHNTIILRPFAYLDMFKNTSLTWNTNLKLYRRDFTGTAIVPKWENKFLDIKDDQSFTENSISLKLAASQMEGKFSQSLGLNIVMPPLLTQYNFNLNLIFPYVSLSLDTGFYETSKDDVKAEDKWKKKPLSQSLSLSLFNSRLSITEGYTHNLEKNKPETFRTSISFAGLNLSFLMSNTLGYDFDNKNGWEVRSEEEFLPTSLSFSYNTPNKSFNSFGNKISFTPGLSTSIVADLIRPTNSYLLFTPSISLNITDFLSITFSATSKNSVLYWYFKNDQGDLYSEWGGFPGNIAKDLINSFRFDDNSIREKSGFKLKSFNLALEHNLHDWKLNMELRIEPRVLKDGNTQRYDYAPYFSIGIVWNPMESMKTQITDEYGEWEIK